ncbi:uncharacterized protein METZ01_LOCUS327017, partial [marine metagenome]
MNDLVDNLPATSSGNGTKAKDIKLK